MKKQLVIATLLTLAATTASAGPRYECTNNELERVIEVTSPADAPVPCSVDYTKETGETKSLWRANNDENYCLSKASDFLEKQRGWGWTCNVAE